MIIDHTNFNNAPYRIPNQEEVAGIFTKFVEDYERKALIEVLGYVIYKELKEYLDGSPGDDNELYDALIDGGEYEFRGNTYRFDGLATLLVPYVYAFWLSETWDQWTNIGASYPTREDNEHISPSSRVQRAHMDYWQKAGGVFERSGGTLYGFMMANRAADEFEKWNYSPEQPMNVFNL